ncbi:carbon-nitrogen hydrolase family protein [Paraburkholderia pallida]|uniref:Carbon-nitrogen hydrolase family protein n=1 Tax=Paraburkholderia pallida TaxID=2547399 RepID=A0A4P7D253_9BURK|nr:carbon-nitrogen hydrolase family protein [Paraburkholderia pallida]QBR00745.1 carbon-nitrogen hydrolase family protein [Paraburkholderia pallida]
MISTPSFIAAAIQAAPVYLNTQATIEKAVRLIHEAAANGARLIAFPEVFVPGYPYWSWMMSPVKGSAWFERLVRQSITVPGPEVDALCEAARQANAYVVIGVNERPSHSLGTLYNTILTIGSDGRLLGRHRKLVPTWAEKLTWGNGDASGLKVHQTEIGPLGALACGENTNTLARFSLLAQGELIHVASYIALPVAPPDYDMAEAIKVRAMAHSFEGKVFTIVSCSTVSEEIVAAMESECDEARSLLTRRNSAFSGVIGPDGRVVGNPLIDEEGIVYAEVDLARCIQPKQMHDIVGHYNRFDIFDLRINASEQPPLQISRPLQARADLSASKTDDTTAAGVRCTDPFF